MNNRVCIGLVSGLALVFATEAGAQLPGRKEGNLNVGIVVHEGVELLDFAGPGEVFGHTDYRVFTVAPNREAVHTNGGPCTVMPDYSISDAPHIDILVVPGGNTTVLLNDEAMMAWIKKTATESKLTMSVCTGAFTLAKSGLLDGKKATTHHSAIRSLKRDYPAITVVENERFVDNGQLVTTAGVSAGIDGALHVVARLLGDEKAWEAARGMQYVWEPPLAKDANSEAMESHAAMKAFVYRDWAAATKAYGAIVSKHPDDVDAAFHLGLSQCNSGEPDRGIVNVEKAIKAGRTDNRSMVVYARTLLVVKRYPESIAAYEKVLAAGFDDHGTSRYNLACACALSGKKAEALTAIEKAVDEGFSDRKLLESDDDLASVREEDRFKAAAKRTGKTR